MDELLVRTKQECENMVIAARASRDAAANKAAAILAEAEAEEAASGGLADKREFELMMARSQVLKQLSQSGKLVIGGETGDALLQQIVFGAPMDTSGLALGGGGKVKK